MRTRSTLASLAALALAGCALFVRPVPAPAPGPAISISDDGQAVTVGGERWTAPNQAAFYQRGDVLHVISSGKGAGWDVPVPVGPGGKLAWPADAPFEASGGVLLLRAGKAAPETEDLIATGQLHPHDDHFHLTHKFQNEDWQALYRLRADDSPLAPIRRQVAAAILALLIDDRIPGSSPAVTAKALRRMASVIGKARRAIEGDVGARAIEAIITNDFEIRDEGKLADIGGQLFYAADSVRFRYCAGHFHVEDAAGKWAQPVEFEMQANGSFAWPNSIFFEIRKDGKIAERPPTTRWRRLTDTGQVHFTRERWHLTETYANPRLQYLLKVIADEKIAAPQRDKARSLALDVLSLRLDIGSDAEFGARLDAIDKAIDRAATQLEKEIREPPKPRR
jgi:hypothetical protein